MSGCRIRKNLSTGCTKPSNEEMVKETDSRLKALLAERERQDLSFKGEQISDTDYEKKHGKQPSPSTKDNK